MFQSVCKHWHTAIGSWLYGRFSITKSETLALTQMAVVEKDVLFFVDRGQRMFLYRRSDEGVDKTNQWQCLRISANGILDVMRPNDEVVQVSCAFLGSDLVALLVTKLGTLISAEIYYIDGRWTATFREVHNNENSHVGGTSHSSPTWISGMTGVTGVVYITHDTRYCFRCFGFIDNTGSVHAWRRITTSNNVRSKFVIRYVESGEIVLQTCTGKLYVMLDTEVQSDDEEALQAPGNLVSSPNIADAKIIDVEVHGNNVYAVSESTVYMTVLDGKCDVRKHPWYKLTHTVDGESTGSRRV